jgi:hypothetical protein
VYTDVLSGGTRTITIPMEFIGNGATTENIVTVKAAIETRWSGAYTADDNSTSLNVVVRVIVTSTGDRNYMYIGVAGVDSPPGMTVGDTGNWPIGLRTGWVSTAHSHALGFYAAHEMGHLFGLGDRYNASGPLVGYEKNIMGASVFYTVARPTFRDIGCIGSKTGGTCN